MTSIRGVLRRRNIVKVAIACAVSAPVSGHHSEAGIDLDSLLTFEATVTEFSWRNPHVYIAAETIDERGEPVEWALQMGSIVTATRTGWTRDSLIVGNRITARVHPARDGRPYGMLESIDKEGEVLSIGVLFTPQVTASASTLEGRWIAANPSELFDYPGGLDGFFNYHLNLTEAGKAAQAAYDELSDENPDSTCIGRPTPASIVSSSLFPLEIQFDEAEETILIRSAGSDEERTVYMDGRSHPDSGERSLGGHSTGRWDGAVLIVDTRNFADHRSPYQVGVPSGAQKHVVEQYRLTEDGTRAVVDFMLEDPEYMTAPMTHSRELIYSPQMEMSRFNCDPEAARRFVPR